MITKYFQVQGQTIKPPQAVVIDMKEARNPAQCYVMLSRAQNLQQIFILDDLYTHNWKVSDDAMAELNRLTREAINNVDSSRAAFRLASINVRSLRKHFDDIKLIPHIDLFCLQETWLHPDEDISLFEIEGLTLDTNSVGRGKGVATYYPEGFVVVDKVTRSDLQITQVSSHDFDLINVYRSQGNTTLIDDLKTLMRENRRCVIVGDLNIDYSEDNLIVAQLLSLGFTQHVSKPTHSEGAILDHCYTNFDVTSVSQQGVYFSDHDVIFLDLDLPKKRRIR